MQAAPPPLSHTHQPTFSHAPTYMCANVMAHCLCVAFLIERGCGMFGYSHAVDWVFTVDDHFTGSAGQTLPKADLSDLLGRFE